MADTADPHPSAAQLAAFDTGQLPASEQEAVERHVRQCPECWRALDTLPEDPLAALIRAFGGGPAHGGSDTAPGDNGSAPLDLPAALAGHPRYRVLEVLGRGGMGVVYRAVHRLMDRVVALKIIDQRLTDRPAFVERFRREVKAAARLSHPHIVTAYDSDQAADTHFLVMEYVPGTSLDRALKERGPFPVTEACEIIRQAALGLQHAHERGMVHRDIKPANLLLTPDGQVKILDFGLARLAEQDNSATPTLPSATIVGTPDYLAPEQARDPRAADIRADIYSLGSTLYHLLTGQPPFPGGTPLQKLLAHQERLPRPVTESRSDVPRALDAIVQRMLAKEPAQRYAAPAEVARALAPLTSGDPSATAAPARKWLPLRVRIALAVGTTAALLVTATVLGVLALRQQPDSSGQTVGTRKAPARGPLPEVRTLRQGPLSMRQLREEALGWIRANNRWGPGHSFVADCARELDPRLDRMGGFQFFLGPTLVKSAKATVLAGHPGGLFLVELPDWLAKESQLEGGTFRFWACRQSNTGEVRLRQPRVWLSALAVDHSDHLVPNGPMTGSLAYRIGERSQGRLALRRTFHYENYWRLSLAFPDPLQSTDQGVLSFTLPAVANAEIRPRGLLLVFMELSSRQGDQVIIESNTVAALVNVTTGP
jgi:predicted Ser/Thr protein kinase